MKTPGSLALDSSVIVRHMRTADAAITAQLKAATELADLMTIIQA